MLSSTESKVVFLRTDFTTTSFRSVEIIPPLKEAFTIELRQPSRPSLTIFIHQAGQGSSMHEVGFAHPKSSGYREKKIREGQLTAWQPRPLGRIDSGQQQRDVWLPKGQRAARLPPPPKCHQAREAGHMTHPHPLAPCMVSPHWSSHSQCHRAKTMKVGHLPHLPGPAAHQLQLLWPTNSPPPQGGEVLPGLPTHLPGQMESEARE